MDSERRRSPAEARRFWELAIDLWSNSGLSVREFCSREGLADNWRSDYISCPFLGSSDDSDHSWRLWR